MARPKLDIDERQIEKLASIGCTSEEIASVIGCAVSTLYDRFSETIKRGHSLRNSSLRRKQYERAMKGSDNMLIWLGKQYLGQKDKAEQEITEHRIVIDRNGSESTTTYPTSGTTEDTEGETAL
jgi:hypothetical protein